MQPAQVISHNKDTGLYSTPTYKPNSLSIRMSPPPVQPTLSLPLPLSSSRIPQNIPDDNASVEDDSFEDVDVCYLFNYISCLWLTYD